MAEIVNLRRARKVRARSQEAARAAENRAKFGRTRAERDMTQLAREHAERRLDAHRLQTDDDTSH